MSVGGAAVQSGITFSVRDAVAVVEIAPGEELAILSPMAVPADAQSGIGLIGPDGIQVPLNQSALIPADQSGSTDEQRQAIQQGFDQMFIAFLTMQYFMNTTLFNFTKEEIDKATFES